MTQGLEVLPRKAAIGGQGRSAMHQQETPPVRTLAGFLTSSTSHLHIRNTLTAHNLHIHGDCTIDKNAHLICNSLNVTGSLTVLGRVQTTHATARSTTLHRSASWSGNLTANDTAIHPGATIHACNLAATKHFNT